MNSRYDIDMLNTADKIREYSDYLIKILPRTHRNLRDKLDPDEKRELIMPKTFTLQVTDDCNLKCSYCYQINKHHNVMSFETAKRAIDIILKEPEKTNGYLTSTNSPGIIIDFIGGEPFLQVDLIDKIMDYFVLEACKLRHPWASYHKFSFSTNGTLYFEPEVQKFLNKWGNEISLSITIDGNKELHDSCRVFNDGSGSYDIAIKAVEDWTSKGNFVGSKITIAPGNVDKISKAIIHMYELKYTDINANCVYEKGWDYSHATILYNELKIIADYIIDNELYYNHRFAMFNKYFFRPKDESDLATWCGGTGDMLSVDYKGLYYPCIRYMESSLGEDCPPITIGDINNGIGQTEEDKEIIKSLKAINRRTQSTDECFNCPIAEGCSYCSAYNYQVFGTPNSRATYICCMHKATALANSYFWNKLFDKLKMNWFFHNYLDKNECLKIISEDEYNMLVLLEDKLVKQDFNVVNKKHYRSEVICNESDI